jgi:hypothetical protein
LLSRISPNSPSVSPLNSAASRSISASISCTRSVSLTAVASCACWERVASWQGVERLDHEGRERARNPRKSFACFAIQTALHQEIVNGQRKYPTSSCLNPLLKI